MCGNKVLRERKRKKKLVLSDYKDPQTVKLWESNLKEIEEERE